MHRSSRTIFAGLIAILALVLTLPRLSLAKTVAYCSPENTSDGDGQYWQWQSQGFCNTACQKDHPFGVIQGQYCWCSDYIPAVKVSNSDCSNNCPGYPTEKCGNLEENLFIYIRLDSNAPVKGTKGASGPTSSDPLPALPSSISSSAVLPEPETVIQTVTVPVTLAPTLISSPPDTSSTLRTSAAPSSSDTPNTQISRVTSVHIITVSGVVVTQTVISSPTSTPGAGPQPKKNNTGAIVGGVVGGLVALGAIVGAIFLTLWRRRRQQERENDDQSGVRRNVSTMSKSGLLGSEKGPQYPSAIATRNSRMLNDDAISPISVSDRRSSRLVFDQRLNPSAIMVLDNSSRDSLGSMDDSQDYGRTLNVRNPDPEPH